MTTPVEVDADAAKTLDDDRFVHVLLRVDRPVSTVWQALVSSEGTGIWLGEGAILKDKGQSYYCTDGSAGVVRSFHPLEQLRLSWHHAPDVEASLIELDVTPEGSGTRLRLWHEGLADEQRPAMNARWKKRLQALLDTV